MIKKFASFLPNSLLLGSMTNNLFSWYLDIDSLMVDIKFLTSHKDLVNCLIEDVHFQHKRWLIENKKCTSHKRKGEDVMWFDIMESKMVTKELHQLIKTFIFEPPMRSSPQ